MKTLANLSARGMIRDGLVPVLFLGTVVALAATGAGPLQPEPQSSPVKGDGTVPKAALLTSRPAPQPLALQAMKVGEAVKTLPGERQRLGLPDGGVVYINEKTEVKLEAGNQLVLAAGEIFVEQAPTGAKNAAVVVQTPNRKITAQNSSFAVRGGLATSYVLVTRGEVQVAGAAVVKAGQRLWDGATKAHAAPRPAHVLGWAQELMTAAEAPLVPESDYSGGALVAIDPNGQEAKLTLRKYHIDVVVEDGFARTTIDQTYFNHENTNLEGTFFFPLPADASLSRLAMYVDGKLMEGGMVERGQGAEIYDTIKYMRKDPALLEWVDGSTFKMRVFPIEGRKEKRLLLSYTQKLPSLYGRATYRFPAGHSLPAVKEWSLAMRLKGGAALNWSSPSHTLTAKADKGDLLLSASAKNALFAKDVVLLTEDPALTDTSAQKVKFATAEHEGQHYLMVKLRPDLLNPVEAPANPGSRHWVFLFESSGDRDPLLGRVQIEVIRHLLLQAQPGDTFNVLTANTKARAYAKTPQPVNAETIGEAIAFLEGSHLIGALNLGNALARAAALTGKGQDTFLVHVGTGIAAMGEKRADVLAKLLPAGVRYVGVGVGKRWDRGFMKSTAEKTGGYFTQINPDESIAWRSFELAGTLQTLGPAGLRKATISGVVGFDGKAPQFLAFNELLTQGEELCAVTRLDAKADLPKGITLKFGDGKEVEVPVKLVKKNAGYLPRMWAKLEIDRLLSQSPFEKEHKDQVIALSKAMYVMSPFTSLLVLENEDMYKQYGVDKGRKDHWAMYPAPAEIEVVYEEDPDMPVMPKGARTPKQVLQSIAGMNTKGYKNEDILKELREEEIDRPSANMHQVIEGKKMAKAKVSEFLGHGTIHHGMNFAGGGSGEVAADGVQHLKAPMALAAAPPAGVPPLELPPGAGPEPGKAEFPIRFPAVTTWNALEGDAKQAAPGGKPAGGGASFSGGPSPVYSSDGAFNGDLGKAEKLQVYHHLLDLKSLHGRESEMATVMMGEISKQSSSQSQNWLYKRLSYTGSDAIFYNLLAYAPGMSTSSADVLAVLEAEAFFPHPPKAGHIDDGAKKLFAKAHKMGWQKLTLDAKKGAPATIITFDGQGRFTAKQTLPPGLTEQVVCDGKSMVHLYPQLGLAAKRNVSRFHRAGISSMLPWVVPPVEDLAKGADIKLVADRTIEIIPHGAGKKIKDKDGKEKEATSYRLRLLFAEEGGQVAERQIVEMPANKVLVRQVCNADGSVRVLDEKGKELASTKGTLSPAQQPTLTSATKDLIVLDLPYRTPEHVREALKIEKKSNNDLTFAQATVLMASYVANGQGGEARNVFQSALQNRNEKQIGYYVLLAAAGQDLGGQGLNVVDDHPDSPLAQYLALHTSPTLRQHAAQWAIGSVQWQDPLLKHLALTHALYQRWQSKQVEKWTPDRLAKERTQALKYVTDNKDSAFGWIMLTLLQDRADKDMAASDKFDKSFYVTLAEHWELFQKSGLSYAARYEEARCLLSAGKAPDARKRFVALYNDTLKDGYLPLLDSDARAALLTAPGASGWGELMQGTAEKLIKDKNRPAVLALAWQCWQLDDAPQANELLQVALTGIKDDKERADLQLAGVLFYQQTKQLPQADQLLAKLLDNPQHAEKPALWRLASELAAQRKMTARSMECLEKALDLEFKKLPDIINVQQVRDDYGSLLAHYGKMADAIVALKLPPPEGFIAKVVKMADRWRALDLKSASACNTAADILIALGQKDLGWDYLTTPVAMQPNESGPWSGLAENLRQGGEPTLADLAYRAAFDADPTNPQLLWDRAENLQQSGKTVQCQALYQQIAEGHWGPHHAGLVAQAKQRLK